jgi:DNA-binding NtrC family response regulator
MVDAPERRLKTGARILVIDDEEVVRKSLQEWLHWAGHRVEEAESGQAALDLLRDQKFDVMITDLKVPGMDGIEIMKQAHRIAPGLETIIMTAYGSVSSAVAAIREGAYDYVEKPFCPERVEILIDKILRQNQLQEENANLRERLEKTFTWRDIVGKSTRMQAIFTLIETVAPTTATVLIEGESGTGKEVVARAIWSASERSSAPFIAIDCASIPETLLASELFGHEKGAFTGALARKLGKFEYASGGTIFLDEVGNIPPSVQHYLLRILQEKEFSRIGGNEVVKVDARIIAATNKDLREEIRKGGFREDLYYRLNVVNIKVPPLRERQEDIPLLARHLMQKYCIEYKKEIITISDGALEALMRYPFPGNVRELENVIERSVIVCQGKSLTPENLPEHVLCHQGETVASTDSSPTTLKALERQHIARVLSYTKGNISQAAKILGVQRNTIKNKIREYGLTAG